jgi:hypothetical protein
VSLHDFPPACCSLFAALFGSMLQMSFPACCSLFAAYFAGLVARQEKPLDEADLFP